MVLKGHSYQFKRKQKSGDVFWQQWRKLEIPSSESYIRGYMYHVYQHALVSFWLALQKKYSGLVAAVVAHPCIQRS